MVKLICCGIMCIYKAEKVIVSISQKKGSTIKSTWKIVIQARSRKKLYSIFVCAMRREEVALTTCYAAFALILTTHAQVLYNSQRSSNDSTILCI